MSPEITAYIQKHKIYQSSVAGLAAMLPGDDAVLDEWMADAVARREQVPLMFLILATLHQGRPVQARHLTRGAVLLQHANILGGILWHMEGTPAEAAAEALNNSSLNVWGQAELILSAAAWCKEKGDGTFPPGLRSAARRLARMPLQGGPLIGALVSAALIMQDDDIIAILMKTLQMPAAKRPALIDAANAGVEVQLGYYRGGPFALLGQAAPKQIANGQVPMRYSQTVSAKSPCPCGSGKKYKHCCLQKELASRETVPGAATADCSESRLSAKVLAKLNAAQLAHLDPCKLRPAVLDEYFAWLTTYMLWDVATDALGKLGYSSELEKSWERVMFLASREGQKEVIEQLVAIREKVEPVKVKGLPVVTRLLLLSDDAGEYLDTLDGMAYWTLKLEEQDNWRELAMGLLRSRSPGIGILVARSFLPLLPQFEAHQLLDEILACRDRIHLPPDEVFTDIVEKKMGEALQLEGKDAAALRDTQRRLEAKAGEVRQLKSRLDHLNHEVGRLEQVRHHAAARPAPSPTKPVAAPADEDTLKDLRRKVEELKALLNSRHEERTALRRELSVAHETLGKARAAGTGPPTGRPTDEDAENAHLLPAEPHTVQPLRVPEYPRRFHETLHLLPPVIASQTLVTIARLASGEAEAFHGTVRLKALPNVLRLRIGSDYRLLFRLHAERLEIVDLINRRDLDRRIKSLLAAG